MRCLPDFPAAPQLPARDPREGMLAQWLGALPEVAVAPDGSFVVVGDVRRSRPSASSTSRAHAGLLDVPRRRAPRSSSAPVRVKVQVTGPLTLGVALHAAGVPEPRAFRRAAEVARAWSVAIEELVTTRLPDSRLVLFFDEPALVAWRRGEAPLDRESAIDVLSGALAAVDCVTGVHVCGDGDVGLGAGGGPAGARRRGERRRSCGDTDGAQRASSTATVGSRGARCPPTGRSANRPIRTGVRSRRSGASSRGAGAIPCRCARAGMITPACGLAGYGASQAERVLGIARELAARVHDQAVAARLTLGA